MKKTIRCPKCGRKLYDITGETRGLVKSQCSKCKAEVIAKFFSPYRRVIKIE